MNKRRLVKPAVDAPPPFRYIRVTVTVVSYFMPVKVAFQTYPGIHVGTWEFKLKDVSALQVSDLSREITIAVPIWRDMTNEDWLSNVVKIHNCYSVEVEDYPQPPKPWTPFESNKLAS